MTELRKGKDVFPYYGYGIISTDLGAPATMRTFCCIDTRYRHIYVLNAVNIRFEEYAGIGLLDITVEQLHIFLFFN
jgi:hypothetical protein